MGQARGVIQIIPNVWLGKAFALRELNAAREIIVRIHITRQGLEARDPKRDYETNEEENSVVSPVHL
jgi:hypothetical protein